ncbi:transposase [Thermodesulfobacteriota bacterium]
MPRTPRLLIPNEPTVYHVMSRTALPGLPMGDVEKDYLLGLMKRLGRLYFTEIMGFCCMGNHFHLLVRMLPQEQFTDQDILIRHQQFYGDKKLFSEGHIPCYRQKWASLSEFIKQLKQSFSRWYNKRSDRKGFFWSERFKSVIVEKGETLVNCLAYIDLNPVRAGIVAKPEQYRWSSLGFHVQAGSPGDFLSLDFGLKQFGQTDDTERLRRYREYVYEAGGLGDTSRGARIAPEIVQQERRKGYVLSRQDRFLFRSRYFTDSAVIGTREFVQESFQRFRQVLKASTERQPKRITGLEGMYSLKRLGV